MSERAIVCVFSVGLFAGSIWTKVLQSAGDMKKGFRRSPDKSVYLRLIARIFRIGIPNILMQSASTFYILGLNLILSTFSDQAVGYSLKSSALTIIRTVVLFVPPGFLFSRFGLGYFWLTFPVTETLTCIVGAVFYNQFLRKNAPAANTRSSAV